MTSTDALTWHAALAGRWIARIVGTLMVLFLLVFLLGDVPPPIWRLNPREQLLSLAMGALFLGLVLAWRCEGLGGLLTLAGWGLFSMVERRPMWDLPFAIPAAAGALHVLSWLRLRGPAPALPVLTPLSVIRLRTFWITACALLAIFVLLSANEIFGQPPLMTPRALPGWLPGTWSTTLHAGTQRSVPDEFAIEFVLRPDGTVTGKLAGVEIANAQLTRNRSWFGRLMRWRTDYVIHGELAGPAGAARGGNFSLLLDAGGTGLTGSLTHAGAGRAVVLRKHQERSL